MLEPKEKYDLQELYDELPITLVALGQIAKINEVTIARIRDGKPTRRSTINRLLAAFSQVYERPFSVRNVSNINVMRNVRLEKKEAKTGSSKEEAA